MGTRFWQCPAVDEARVRAVIVSCLVSIEVPFSAFLGGESPDRPLLLRTMFATGEGDHRKSDRHFLVVRLLTLALL